MRACDRFRKSRGRESKYGSRHKTCIQRHLVVVYLEMMYMNGLTKVKGCELKGRTENEDRLFRIE
jgi:hypothetical protein